MMHTSNLKNENIQAQILNFKFILKNFKFNGFLTQLEEQMFSHPNQCVSIDTIILIDFQHYSKSIKLITIFWLKQCKT